MFSDIRCPKKGRTVKKVAPLNAISLETTYAVCYQISPKGFFPSIYSSSIERGFLPKDEFRSTNFKIQS